VTSQEDAIHLRNEIKSFLLAGHETSASMLTWTVFQLTQNPDIAQKVIEEGQ
jgi:cytochrome P450